MARIDSIFLSRVLIASATFFLKRLKSWTVRATSLWILLPLEVLPSATVVTAPMPFVAGIEVLAALPIAPDR